MLALRVTVLDIADSVDSVHIMVSCEILLVYCKGLHKKHSCVLADFFEKQC